MALSHSERLEQAAQAAAEIARKAREERLVARERSAMPGRCAPLPPGWYDKPEQQIED